MKQITVLVMIILSFASWVRGEERLPVSYFEANSTMLTLSGLATNVTANKQANIAFDIYEDQKGSYRAIGGFDSRTLFGQFNLTGLPYVCIKPSSLCLRFVGALVLSKDNSGYEDNTATDFLMDVNIDLTGGRTDGQYKIGEIPPSWPIEQNGVLELRCRMK